MTASTQWNATWNGDEIAEGLSLAYEDVYLLGNTLYARGVTQSALNLFISTYTPSPFFIRNTVDVQERRELRRIAYFKEADPLFFKAQAGEDGVTLEQWEAKRQEIKDRYPYPTA